MKTDKKMLYAFILNLFFSFFEFVGGILTGSTAVISDAVHDIGDAASIGFSLFFEKKSNKAPDEIYTYGYRRFSVMGGAITTIILLLGSVAVIVNAIARIINPVQIDYTSLLFLSVIGVAVNLLAAFLTHDKSSINQKAVNLHMLEDVLGWIVVLIGAIIMRFTDCVLIDPIMTIGIALFIIISSIKNLKEIIDLFLEKVPCGISVSGTKKEILDIDGVDCICDLHIWSIDGQLNCADVHVILSKSSDVIKEKIRHVFKKHNIIHSIIETDTIASDHTDCILNHCSEIAHTHCAHNHKH